MFKRAKQAIKRHERTILYSGLYITTMGFVIYLTAYTLSDDNLERTWNAIKELELTEKVTNKMINTVLEEIK